MLLGAACASSRGPAPAPAPFPRPGMPPSWAPAPVMRDAGNADRIITTALALQGSRYVAGGAAPGGFDCSGFTHYVFGRHGVSLPRTAAEQYREGHAVDRNDLQPGDLVFFDTTGSGPSHVGLAIGDGQFVHAPNQRSAVRIDALDASYWSRRFLGVRRYVAAGS